MRIREPIQKQVGLVIELIKISTAQGKVTVLIGVAVEVDTATVVMVVMRDTTGVGRAV